MTDLLPRPDLSADHPPTARRPSGTGRALLLPALRRPALRRLVTRRAARPGWAGAALGGVATAMAGLTGCVLLVLAGWAGSGTGVSAGSTLRAGLLAWLIGHGSGVQAETVDVTATPLGLTLLLAGSAFIGARRVRVGSRWRDGLVPRAAGQVVGRVTCFATAYTAVALAAASLASTLGLQVHQGRALLVAWALAAAAGWLGLVGPRTVKDRAYRTLPFAVLAVVRGAVAGCCVLLAGTVGVFTASLLLSVGGFADLVGALDPTWPGALMLLATFVLALPNLLGLTGSVLLGPGFALGSGTTVTATSVALGTLPGWPPLAALPDTGPTPGWAVALLTVPVVSGVAAGWLAAASSPGGSLRRGCAAVAAGLVAGLLVGGWVLASGGAVGPGRMAEVGAATACLPVAVATLGAGALIGGCAQLVAAGRAHR